MSKKFKQQSSKQLTLIKFTKEYEDTKIFSWATTDLSRKHCDSLSYCLPLPIFSLLIHHFSDFHCLHQFFNFNSQDMHYKFCVC